MRHYHHSVKGAGNKVKGLSESKVLTISNYAIFEKVLKENALEA